MESYCLHRVFHPRSGRCFDAAVGQGFFMHDGADVPTALAMISQLPAHDR